MRQKLHFLLLFVLFTATVARADVEINEKNFPDYNFRNWVLSQGYGEDGVLTESEIANITEMVIVGIDFKSLKGIEYFTALDYLRCESNELTSLDVSGCIALTYLDCVCDQLISLNVTDCTALTYLRCNSDQLISLSISGCIALEYMDYSDRHLTSLNISGCTSLTDFFSESNTLTSLNVTNCTSLENFYFAGNHLISLNVSGCTALQEIYYDCSHLASLNVSGCSSLYTLDCYGNELTYLDASGCTSLEYFDCSGNNLTSLYISGCTYLTGLYCSGNKLTLLDVSGCTSLMELDCSGNELTLLDVSGCTSLEQLDCYKNQISGLSMDAFISALPDRTKDQYGEIHVYDSASEKEGNICTQSQTAAMRAKNWTPYFTRDNGRNWQVYAGRGGDIEINERNFPDQNFRAYLLKNYGSVTDAGFVTQLDVSSLGITSLKGIEYFTSLTKLWCGNNQLTSLDLSKNVALESLECSGNQLTLLDVSGCRALISLRCERGQLTSLDVSKNAALESLDCRGNQLVSLDVSKNTALESLDCSGNLLVLLDVSKNVALESLKCNRNQLTLLDVSQNVALESMECMGNQLIALDVSNNIKLNVIYCDRNRIKRAAMDAFISSLPMTHGKVYIYSAEGEYDGNVCYKSQVAAIKAKSWTPYYYPANQDPLLGSWIVKEKGEEYDGEDEPDGGIDINEENFPDENFRNYLINATYYGRDDILTDKEIESVTFMDITDKEIHNLKGIEYFAALTALGCSNNQLTTLDVSRCVALSSINCSGNQLTTLDVSGCVALAYINCSGNQLTTLDVSGCVALTNLYCYNNQLTTLNVSGCTELRSIYCYQNRIEDAGMNALVESLPIVENIPPKPGIGHMYVISNENEQNVMTVAHVAIAKAKNWLPYYRSIVLDKWQEYAGSEDDGNTIGCVSADDGKDATLYNLSGQRMGQTQRGMNIIRTADGVFRKILVK